MYSVHFVAPPPPDYLSLAPFYSRAAVCEWNDVGNIAFDVHVKKLKVCVNGVWRQVDVTAGEIT